MTNGESKTNSEEEPVDKSVSLPSDHNLEQESIEDLSNPEKRAAFFTELLFPLIKEQNETLGERLQNTNTSEYLAFQEVMLLRAVLTEETDRGCALMAAAYLDEELQKLIKARLVDDERVVNELFNHNGSLGSFSSRINFSYTLGLISGTTRNNLHLLRKVRNEFAHLSSRVSFDTNFIASRCYQLKGVGLSKDVEPRDIFIRCVMGIAGLIHSKTSSISHIKEEESFDGEKLEEAFEKLVPVALDKLIAKIAGLNNRDKL